jgi:branched-chain amino acid transport system ATP-binding protein
MSAEVNDRQLVVDGVDVVLGGTRILHDISFKVRPGETFGIIGPNGAGKTTLLNVISCVLRPASGSVTYGGVDLKHTRAHNIRHHGMGRSLQSTHYFRELTALELVALGELPNNVPGALGFGMHRYRRFEKRQAKAAERMDRAAEALAQFDLTPYAGRRLGELSTAVQKLVDIARAVVPGTHLLLLDEPTSGVSGRARGSISDALQRLRELGRTTVLIDHDPGFVVANCDRVLAMNFGEVLHIGLPDEVMSSPVVKRSYLGETSGEETAASTDAPS